MREKINLGVYGILSLLLIVSLISNVSAITASIGSARMILYPSTGESVERSILVKNVNDVPVSINISVTGDLANYVKLNENNFRLEAGEERKVYFTIKADKEGQTETKINIGFNPEVGRGVGLFATIIVIATGNDVSSDDSNDNANTNSATNTDNGTTNPSYNGVTFGSRGGTIGSGPSNSNGKLNISPLTILMISTGVLIIILIILIIIAGRKKSVTVVNKNVIKNENRQSNKEKINKKKRLKESRE